MRLSGFEVIAATRTAGPYDSSYPWRLVLHRTQGSTIAGAVGAYRSHEGWPHITASYREKRRAQHIDLHTAARALRNASGGEQTNLARCIQVELTGFSETPMTNAEADWVADQVIAPIIAAVPEIGLHGPQFYDDNEGIVLATASSPVRMSAAQWRAFDGICGHQHVPENTHWDPGRIPLVRILNRLSSSPSTGDWFDMATEQDLERAVKTYARNWFKENVLPLMEEVHRQVTDDSERADTVHDRAKRALVHARSAEDKTDAALKRLDGIEADIAAIKAAVTADES